LYAAATFWAIAGGATSWCASSIVKLP
jgi:hypothetical protein